MRVRSLIQRVGMEAVVPVKRPEIEIAFQRVVVRLAEQRPDARGGLALAARDDDKRPRPFPFVIFFPAVVNPGEERPEHGGGIALGRARAGCKTADRRGIFPGCRCRCRCSAKNEPARARKICHGRRWFQFRRNRWSAWSRPCVRCQPAARIASRAGRRRGADRKTDKDNCR